MSTFAQMPQALADAYAHAIQRKSLRELAKGAGLSPSTFSRALRFPMDMKLSTLLALWKGLGYTPSLWCHSEGKRMYVFEENTDES